MSLIGIIRLYTKYDTRFSKYRIELIVSLSLTNATKKNQFLRIVFKLSKEVKCVGCGWVCVCKRGATERVAIVKESETKVSR